MSLSLGCPLVQPVVGVPYSQAVPVAGGTPAYTITKTSGTLPPGLALAGGIISGIPTTAGTFSYVLHVADGMSNTRNANCTLQVAAQAPVAEVILPDPPFHAPLIGSPAAETDASVILGTVPPGMISEAWRGWVTQITAALQDVITRTGGN